MGVCTQNFNNLIKRKGYKRNSKNIINWNNIEILKYLNIFSLNNQPVI